VRTTSTGHTAPYSYQRPSWRRPLIVFTVIVALLAVGGYTAYTVYGRYVQRLLTIPGCQAGIGVNAVGLDFGQAADAATIAGVAAKKHLPSKALTIAYATALQESKLENPSYGDRDSVGVFQQRPSEGWGTTAELEDPAFAAGAFFRALVKIPHYLSLPVYQAAQDVQRSADGSAYQQYSQTGATLAADFTARPHAVTCWYQPAAKTASGPNLSGAARGLDDTFGVPGEGGALKRVSRVRSADSELISARSGSGWTVADWLVTNAKTYGITQVSYGGYRWAAGLGETSWQADPAAGHGDIVAS
jgi:hypothetical protein